MQDERAKDERLQAVQPDGLLTRLPQTASLFISKTQDHQPLLMARSDLHVVYVDQFRNHPEGHALYTKVSASCMKPGACGFFSGSGQWTTIQEVADTEADCLVTKGWKAPQQSIRIEQQSGIEWPIRLSDSVKEIKVTADATSR
jgi:hypothetical protein